MLCSPLWAQTSSPFAPPEQKLGVYVINSGQGLDTGCTYRSGGPLVIKLPIPQVVNESQLNADGSLKDPSGLVRKGILSAQAVLRFPVFDIDDKAVVSGFAPEIDRLSFNGTFKRTLAGFNNTWTDDSLVVPIEELRFGKDNTLQIDIDTANAGSGEYWCMAVDWLSAEFEAAAPYVLAHGISASETTWDEAGAPGVITALNERGVLFTRFSLGAGQDGNGSVAANAREQRGNLDTWLAEQKSDRVHVIAHSKGGLDTQGLQALAPKFKLLSLSTLSTPHRGSVAADLSLIQKSEYDDLVAAGADPNGFAQTYLDTWTFGQGPQLPGLRDLATYSGTPKGNIANTFTIGADADANGDNDLSAAEAAPLFPGVAAYAARRAWLVLRDFGSATMSFSTVPGRFWGTRTVLTYTTHLAPTPQANDIVVTLNSANPGFGTPMGNVTANHSSVKSAANVNRLLDRSIPIKD
ncbi:MAG: alpha/beta hydrolase [Paucibacter sp.]|nr:alpha/beta hydrolase [Roseateles sp.]